MYLNTKGTTVTTAVAITTTQEIGAGATVTTAATVTPAKIIPEQSLPVPSLGRRLVKLLEVFVDVGT